MCCFHIMRSQKHAVLTGTIAEATVVLFTVIYTDFVAVGAGRDWSCPNTGLNTAH